MKKQSVQLNTDEIRLQSLSKSKTEKVLQKWASDEGEIQEEDIRKAASNYARLEINNRILKWIIVVVIVFLFVLLGFMIASVVIGVNITKDITVKNGALVSNTGNKSIIKTSNMKYNSKITLNSPIDVVDSMKTVTLTISEGLYSAIVQFDVVSYVFIPGKQLTFYGHTHMANVKADGSVEYDLLIPFDGVKRDSSDSAASGTSISGSHTVDDNTINYDTISICSDFAKLQSKPDGYFKITTSLACTLQSSTTTFTGTLDGQRNWLTLLDGSQPIFQTLQGNVNNLFVKGTVNDSGSSGVLAKTVLGGASVSGCGIYATLNAATAVGQNNRAGLFFGTAKSTDGSLVTITKSVSQGLIYGNNPSSSFVGIEESATSILDLKYNAQGTKGVTTGKFAFLQNGDQDCQKDKHNYCLVDVNDLNNVDSCCYNIPYNYQTPNSFFQTSSSHSRDTNQQYTVPIDNSQSC